MIIIQLLLINYELWQTTFWKFNFYTSPNINNQKYEERKRMKKEIIVRIMNMIG